MSIDKIEKLKELVAKSNNIVFFGGAGVSTESNIPDFRSDTGLYTNMQGQERSPEYILSRSCFDNEKEFFYDFYKNKMVHRDAEPNYAHIALAELERQGKVKAVVTQNVDGLHQKAGSEVVYELHGSMLRNYCMDCHTFHDLDYVMSMDGVPKCKSCGGVVKPDVVLYEEGLDQLTITSAVKAISEADTLIVGGTSLRVYPAANLINYFGGDNLVLINKSETPYTGDASLVINDSIGKVFKELI